MKTYPSIARSPRGRKITRRLHLFDKLDGNNLRFEWSRRHGWTRFGSRTRIVDDQHPIFGSAMALFQATLAEPIAKVAIDQRWDSRVDQRARQPRPEPIIADRGRTELGIEHQRSQRLAGLRPGHLDCQETVELDGVAHFEGRDRGVSKLLRERGHAKKAGTNRGRGAPGA